MRNRAYRRYIQEKKVTLRLKRITSHNYWGHTDINNINRENAMLKDYIGTSYNFMFKSFTTHTHDSSHKIKYSPNRSKLHWRNNKKSTREYQKKVFLKILKEYGIK